VCGSTRTRQLSEIDQLKPAAATEKGQFSARPRRDVAETKWPSHPQITCRATLGRSRLRWSCGPRQKSSGREVGAALLRHNPNSRHRSLEQHPHKNDCEEGNDVAPGVQHGAIICQHMKALRGKHREPDGRRETSADCDRSEQAVFAGGRHWISPRIGSRPERASANEVYLTNSFPESIAG
jgi:hypothetical protein